MSIPDFQSLMLPVLKALSDGAETPTSEVRARVADAEGLTQDEIQKLLPSGRQPVFTNRVAWAVTHMKRAGLVESVRRGVYKLTAEGERVLSQAPTRVDIKFLKSYPAYKWSRKGQSPENTDTESVASDDRTATPEEVLDRAVEELRQALEMDVLDRVRDAEPKFLEKVAIDLLIKMGYGGGDAEMGQVTGHSGDGGIDGIIQEDALGLDEVYLQAKKYADGNTVGERDLRDFAGAIDKVRATKGVFITTASFTSAAKEYVKLIQKRIILIDGEELARLMVKYGVGVRTGISYAVRQVDESYFDPEYL